MIIDELVIQEIFNFNGDSLLETLETCLESRTINEAIFDTPIVPGGSYPCLFIANGVQIGADIYHYGSGAYRILKITDAKETRKRIRRFNNTPQKRGDRHA